MKFVKNVRKLRVDDASPDVTSNLDVLDKVRDPVALTHSILNTGTEVRKRKYLYLRLSEIDGACAREWVIGQHRDTIRLDRVAFANVCAMELGSALHWWLQNNKTFFGDRLVGYWKCSACGSRRRFGVKPVDPCEFCGASHNATFYSEYMFRLDRPYRVVGKTDGILGVGSGVYRFAEIKSYGKPIDRPEGAHVAQLASYMWFSQFDESDDKPPIEIDRSVGYLIYFSKMFNYRAPVKTFPVVVTERMIAPYRAKAEAYTTGVRDGVLPPVLTVCSRGQFATGRPVKCPVMDQCKDFYDRGIENIQTLDAGGSE